MTIASAIYETLDKPRTRDEIARAIELEIEESLRLLAKGTYIVKEGSTYRRATREERREADRAADERARREYSKERA